MSEAKPFSREEREELWTMIHRYPDGSTYGEMDLARYEMTVVSLEEELKGKVDPTMPCYLCAVPGKDERCSTSVCGSCGELLRARVAELGRKNERLQAALAFYATTGSRGVGLDGGDTARRALAAQTEGDDA